MKFNHNLNKIWPLKIKSIILYLLIDLIDITDFYLHVHMPIILAFIAYYMRRESRVKISALRYHAYLPVFIIAER